jgi:hypothetical protein
MARLTPSLRATEVEYQRTRDISTAPAPLILHRNVLVWSAHFAIRYSARGDYRSAGRHGIIDEDIVHAVEHALAAGEQDDGKVLLPRP